MLLHMGSFKGLQGPGLRVQGLTSTGSLFGSCPGYLRCRVEGRRVKRLWCYCKALSSGFRNVVQVFCKGVVGIIRSQRVVQFGAFGS